MTPAEQRAANRLALAEEDERVRLLIADDPIAQEAQRLSRASADSMGSCARGAVEVRVRVG